jgi:hypothetical protein
MNELLVNPTPFVMVRPRNRSTMENQFNQFEDKSDPPDKVMWLVLGPTNENSSIQGVRDVTRVDRYIRIQTNP